MTAQVQQSQILNKIKKRAKGAYARHRDDEPKAKGSSLPGGIINGIARLTSWKMGETQDKKEPFVSITGIVIVPPEHHGARATMLFKFNDTSDRPNGKTTDERVAEFQNAVKLIGGDLSETNDIDDIPPILDALCQEQQCFLFNTFRPEPTPQFQNPMTYVFPQGVTDPPPGSEQQETVEDGPDDDSTGEDSSQEEAAAPTPAPASNGTTSGPTTGKKIIKKKVEAPPPPPAEETDDWTPAIDDVYYYRPNSKVAKGEHAVTAVNAGDQTVSLRRLSDNKSLTGIPWAKLEGE